MDSNKLKFFGYGTLLSLILIVIYQLFVNNLAIVTVSVETDKRTLLKIYYNEPGAVWSEKKVGTFLIVPDTSEYSLRLTDIREIEKLRIDTSESQANVTVRSLAIRQPGLQTIFINSPEQFKNLEVGPGVEQFSYNDTGFTVIPSTKDPQLFYELAPLQKTDDRVERYIIICALICTAFFIIFVSQKAVNNYMFVPVLATVVFTLIVVMAVISEFNQHPDEMVHVKAATYFQDNHLPPAIGDEDIIHTYSTYGVSRLHSGEIAYYFAGKFTRLLGPLQLPNYLTSRYFNVALFAILLVCAFYSFHFRILLIPLLLSPQIWYIFSYFNSEAFAIFILVIVAYQMVKPQSWWNRLLAEGDDFPIAPLAILVLGLLLGLVFLLKKNFYFFLVFVFVYLLWRIFFNKTVLTGRVVFRAVSVLLVGICLFGAVRGVDAYVNDFQKSAKILEARELYAGEMFKPSTPLEKKFVFLQMKERGVSFKEVVRDLRWGEKIFRTSFGEYGYTTVAGSFNYYDCVRYLCIGLGLVVVISVLVVGGLEGTVLLAGTVGCAVALMVMAFYHAWAVDFQAQGRYFLPIVGMLSLTTYHLRKSLANFPCSVLGTALFLTAFYSFIFVALAGIGKLSLSIG